MKEGRHFADEDIEAQGYSVTDSWYYQNQGICLPMCIKGRRVMNRSLQQRKQRFI